jgi:predicted negative regulator of RcsB-dependent stress response
MELFAVESVTLLAKDVAIILLAALAAVAVIGWRFRKDTQIEERRKAAIELARMLEDLGLDRAADAAADYAVGDYSGLYGSLKTLAKELLNPEKAMDVLSKAFFKQVPRRLEREGDREKLLKMVAEWQSQHPAVPSTASKVG